MTDPIGTGLGAIDLPAKLIGYRRSDRSGVRQHMHRPYRQGHRPQRSRPLHAPSPAADTSQGSLQRQAPAPWAPPAAKSISIPLGAANTRSAEPPRLVRLL